MYDFNKVFKETQPLRDKLDKFQRVVDEKMAELRVKKEALATIQSKIKLLEDQFNETIAKKEKLSKDISDCQIKLDRAQKLTSGLSDEKVTPFTFPNKQSSTHPSSTENNSFQRIIIYIITITLVLVQ